MQLPIQRDREAEENVTVRQPDTSNRLDWNRLALWLFVVICFAALAFLLSVLWGKCRGDSPF